MQRIAHCSQCSTSLQTKKKSSIKQEMYQDAKEQLTKVETVLAKFEEGNCGQQLKRLEKKLEEGLSSVEERVFGRLDKEWNELKMAKNEWEQTLQKLVLTAAQPGNNFVTWGIGDIE